MLATRVGRKGTIAQLGNDVIITRLGKDAIIARFGNDAIGPMICRRPGHEAIIFRLHHPSRPPPVSTRLPNGPPFQPAQPHTHPTHDALKEAEGQHIVRAIGQATCHPPREPSQESPSRESPSARIGPPPSSQASRPPSPAIPVAQTPLRPDNRPEARRPAGSRAHA